MYRRVWVISSARLGVIFLGILLEAGCTSYLSSGDTSQSALLPQRESNEYANQSTFPPQRVMESSEYAKFLADNSRMLEQCQQGMGCEIALFNLGFVYVYPHSPYYDPPKAVQYFDELLKKYPRSSWANEGRAWRALLQENVALAEKQRRLEDEFRSKDATVRSLQMQLERSRDLDIEYDKKKWELLH